MKKRLTALLLLATTMGFAQTKNDSLRMSGIFERITGEVQSYKIDTSFAPHDKITAKIIELRELRGGFNINEAIEFKLQEEAKEGKTPAATLDLLRREFTSGRGKRWLDNAVIHIYRQHFTYKELRQLVRFYQTSAGRKMADDFPFIMMKTLMAGQIIHDVLVKEM